MAVRIPTELVWFLSWSLRRDFLLKFSLPLLLLLFKEVVELLFLVFASSKGLKMNFVSWAKRLLVWREALAWGGVPLGYPLVRV